jgi:hypothetical protein
MTVKELSETAGVSDAARILVQEDSTPSSYLETLEKQELYQDAIRFLAYKLPVDAGVKWASACIKELRSPESQAQKDEELDAADQWIKTPGDPTRWAAKDAADKSKKNGPCTLLAMAVWMSGGSMTKPPAPDTPPPPNVSQKMIAGSILVIVVSYEAQKAKERYKKALAIGKLLDA